MGRFKAGVTGRLARPTGEVILVILGGHPPRTAPDPALRKTHLVRVIQMAWIKRLLMAEPMAGQPVPHSELPPGAHREVRRMVATMRTLMRSMSNESICYVWETNVQRLRCDVSATERLALDVSRELLLDELKRRDPAGFANWKADGESTTANPHQFISSELACTLLSQL